MEILSAKDVATYLNINEKKIYQLAKDGEIPHTRIGGKVVFAKEIIDRWIRQKTERESNILAAGSDDILLKDLLECFNRQTTQTVFYATVGSLNGLKLLREGRACVCCAHVLDWEGKHNLSYLDRYLNRRDFVVIRLFTREQGLYLAKDNPHRVKRFKDVFDRNLRFVTRNPGAGTRLIIDYLMQSEHLTACESALRAPEMSSHFSAGLKVLLGEADAAFGIRYVAEMLNLHFVALIQEPFDLIISRDVWETKTGRELVAFFDQSRLAKHLPGKVGYDVSAMGNVVWHPDSAVSA